MEANIKEQFVAELRKAGYQTGYDRDIPYVYVGNASDLPPVSKKVGKIAEKIGYTSSRGIAVRAGAKHQDVIDDEPDENVMEEEDISEESSSSTDEEGQMSFL